MYKRQRPGDAPARCAQAAPATDHHCAAPGCPLDGTTARAVGGAFICWVHNDFKEAATWEAVTEGIRATLGLIAMAGKIDRLPLIDLERKTPEIVAWVCSRGLPHLARKTNEGQWPPSLKMEPRTAWAARIRREALVRIRERVDAGDRSGAADVLWRTLSVRRDAADEPEPQNTMFETKEDTA